MKNIPAYLAADREPPPAARSGDLESGMVIHHLHRDFVSLDGNLTVGRAVEALHRRHDDGRILYFYVVDEVDALIGVMPARFFITKDPQGLLREVCIRDLITVPADASLAEAARLFDNHRFLALPVVDRRRHLVGVLDLHVFAERKGDLSVTAVRDEVFQTIGIRLGGLVGAGPLKAWRLRFPWLLSTVAGGLLCVLVSSAFEDMLASRVVIAIFLAPILALGESTAIQSMTIALQVMGVGTVGIMKALAGMARELVTGLLLGLAAGLIIFSIEGSWKGFGRDGLAILGSVVAAMGSAALVGFSLPLALRALKVNLKVAAGPIVLAVADVATVLIYLGLASRLG
jgi:magnesium transporter